MAIGDLKCYVHLDLKFKNEAEMRLSRALQEKLMDVRLRDKLLAEGKLTKEEVKKFLDDSADEAKNATYTDKNSDED